jgi:hypothetical protein
MRPISLLVLAPIWKRGREKKDGKQEATVGGVSRQTSTF